MIRAGGFETEANHYEQLKYIFGEDSVSSPKGGSNGSDFIVNHNNQIITFESKSANTDIYDAGTIGIFSCGSIFKASPFLKDNHIAQLEAKLADNIQQVREYSEAANTNVIPHVIDKELYNNIKADGKLIYIKTDPIDNIVEDSFIHSKNKFVKANYVIVDDNIYCVSDKEELDPLHLQHFGATVLNNDAINHFHIRSSRGSSRNGVTSVNLRLQYRMFNKLPTTNVRLSDCFFG